MSSAESSRRPGRSQAAFFLVQGSVRSRCPATRRLCRSRSRSRLAAQEERLLLASALDHGIWRRSAHLWLVSRASRSGDDIRRPGEGAGHYHERTVSLSCTTAGQVGKAAAPRHGQVTQIRHLGDDLFTGISPVFDAVQYNSLTVKANNMSDELEAIAWATNTGKEEILGLRHRSKPLWGVQYHPEVSGRTPSQVKGILYFVHSLSAQQMAPRCCPTFSLWHGSITRVVRGRSTCMLHFRNTFAPSVHLTYPMPLRYRTVLRILPCGRKGARCWPMTASWTRQASSRDLLQVRAILDQCGSILQE